MHTTIYIHGTLPPKSLFTVPAVQTFFYTPPGLQPVGQLPELYHHRKLAEMLFAQDPIRFNRENFFFYGWSGKLSREEREEEAGKLFNLIKELPKPIRLICHSHGGNVALNLAHLVQEQGAENFFIDELILLGTPVQRETKNYISSPIFRHVYSFHSHQDFIQVADPQGLYEIAAIYKEAGLQKVFMYLQKMQTLFSERHFDQSSNLLQIHSTLGGRSLWHIEFIMPRFFKCLPSFLDAIESENYGSLADDIEMSC